MVEIKKTRREATVDERRMMQKIAKSHTPETTWQDHLSNKQVLWFFTGTGLAIIALCVYHIYFGIENGRPDARMRQFGGIFAGLLLIGITFLVYRFPNLWPTPKPKYSVVEQHIKPLRVIQTRGRGEEYILMELEKHMWLFLNEHAFPELNPNSLARENVILISQSHSIPLTCHGYGDSVPFLKTDRQLEDWEFPASGDIDANNQLDLWFSDLE